MKIFEQFFVTEKNIWLT